MRIALVTETFYPTVDGTTTTVKAVADRLIDTGHEVRIVAPGPGLASYRSCGVARIRPLDKPSGQVRDALESFAPDVVHVTSPRTLGRKALKHARRMGLPTLVVEQSPVLDLVADYWRAKVADRADRVVVTSTWMVERLAEMGVAADLWVPGVDTLAFTPALRDQWLHGSWSRARSAGGPLVVVGFAGSLHKRHGVRRLAELGGIPGIRPVVIGDGPQRDWLAARLPGAKFTGTLTTGDLTVALPSLDLLVHPGEHETCCHVLRAAAASGVPVVAPRAGGAPDVVRHLETGLLYDAAEAGGLREAVASMAADRRRGLLGERARELAVARDWSTAVDELVGLVAPVAG
ncbi:MAG: glycosyl transferase, group 1 [Nocardioides sp.]|nr:glycosyl transferase, group 1 [Nocardioides sp.]